MFTGWGIRTFAEGQHRFNPIGYHLGTVWPHDNSIIAAGFRRYGFDDAALRIFSSMLEAAMPFEETRLPEAFAGYPRAAFGAPVHYPVALPPAGVGCRSPPVSASDDSGPCALRIRAPTPRRATYVAAVRRARRAPAPSRRRRPRFAGVPTRPRSGQRRGARCVR